MTTALPESLGQDSVLAPTYQRPDHLFVRGQGCWLEDAAGRRWLDFTSGIAVTALGHGAPEVADAIREAADGLLHTSNLFHTQPALDLATDLVERSFADRVFFANSGAEANEGAIKFARLAGGPDRRTIVYFDGAFHGRTLGTLAATDRPDARVPFEPLPKGFRRGAWNDSAALRAVDEHTAAAIVEPIQGEAGVRVADASWLRALRDRCDAVGARLILDEIQCGLGRTGHLWAHQEYEVAPHLMTLAKPLAGGLPIGAVLMDDSTARAISAGCHGTTFGGGPLVTRVARRVLHAIDRPAFLRDVRRRGQRLLDGLGALESPLIQEVRGRGLLVGVRLRAMKAVHRAAFGRDLLLVPAGDDVLRFLPPLNVDGSEIDEALTRFRAALSDAEAEEQGEDTTC